MSEEEIKKGNIKLNVFDEMDYEELSRVCNAICGLGYSCSFVDNGNIIFQLKGRGLKN